MGDEINIPTNAASGDEGVSGTGGSVGSKDSGVAVGGTNNSLAGSGAVSQSGAGSVTVNSTDGGAFDLVKYIAGLNSDTLKDAHWAGARPSRHDPGT